MSSCTSIDPLVTAYVDGELSAADRALVDQHLHRCSPCCSRVGAEAAVRELMHARKPALTTECAPANLRAQCREMAAKTSERVSAQPDVGSAIRLRIKLRRTAVALAEVVRRTNPAKAGSHVWGGWAPVALTGTFVVVVAGVFLYEATHYSPRLLAAELAADHVKCFAANSVLGTHHEPAAVESSMLSAFGWRLHLPEQLNSAGLELVGSRRCLYAQGKIAHLMYRDQGRPVSIFMLPKRARPEELVEVLGYEAAIWSTGDRTFVLVTRGSRAEVERVAAFVKAALQ